MIIQRRTNHRIFGCWIVAVGLMNALLACALSAKEVGADPPDAGNAITNQLPRGTGSWRLSTEGQSLAKDFQFRFFIMPAGPEYPDAAPSSILVSKMKDYAAILVMATSNLCPYAYVSSDGLFVGPASGHSVALAVYEGGAPRFAFGTQGQATFGLTIQYRRTAKDAEITLDIGSILEEIMPFVKEVTFDRDKGIVNIRTKNTSLQFQTAPRGGSFPVAVMYMLTGEGAGYRIAEFDASPVTPHGRVPRITKKHLENLGVGLQYLKDDEFRSRPILPPKDFPSTTEEKAAAEKLLHLLFK